METDSVTAVTFIVRLMRDGSSSVTGTVERVRTGFKERFDGYADLGWVVARMVLAEQCRASGDERRLA